MSRNFLDWIFSINSDIGDSSRKVITFLGLKIKLYDMKRELLRRTVVANRNTLFLLYNQLPIANEEDLFYLRTKDIIFIFNKGVLNLDYNFFQDYVALFGFSNNILELIKLEKTSALYQEHINRIKNGEFLWKYVNRNFYIGHSYISCDNGEIFIHSSYVKENNVREDSSNIRHVLRESKRKYIKGITVGDYLKNKPLEFQIEVVSKLLNYVFETFSDDKNPENVSGKLLDCHLYNFILGADGKFYFVDFDLESRQSLDRGYIIFFMLYYYNQELYQTLLQKFGYEDKHGYYQKNFVKPKNKSVPDKHFVASEEHRKLLQKYFTDAGILPEYKI